MASKLSTEQLSLFAKLTPLQQAVALAKATGTNTHDAYKKAKKSKGQKVANNIPTAVSEILSNPNVEAFINSFLAKVMEGHGITAHQVMEVLANVSGINGKDAKPADTKPSDMVAAAKGMAPYIPGLGLDKVNKFEVEVKSGLDAVYEDLKKMYGDDE